MDFVAHYLSKNVYFIMCHGKNSKVTAVNKFQKFRVDTPLNFFNMVVFNQDGSRILPSIRIVANPSMSKP